MLDKKVLRLSTGTFGIVHFWEAKTDKPLGYQVTKVEPTWPHRTLEICLNCNYEWLVETDEDGNERKARGDAIYHPTIEDTARALLRWEYQDGGNYVK